MNNYILKPLCIVIGLAMAGSASAMTMDFSGTNFYMKFLDGNQNAASTSSIDTTSGSDIGQFTEMNLIFKATISPQVEAGGRIQSRSSAAYWTDYGGWGSGATSNAYNDTKFMKLRGAYVELTPRYNWLNLARIGTSDWGMFDPFTVGKVRYIDRDNYNGLYFKGPIASGSSWEFARVSLPNYLQFNYGQGATCCSTDATQYNEAVYIAQFKVPVGGAKLAASYQSFVDHTLASTSNPYTGVNTTGIYKNEVFSFKANGSPADALDLRGAFYWSSSDPSGGSLGENWGNTPRTYIKDKAIKLDADWTTPVAGLAFNFQYFNIGAGYFSMAAARRESDVLLTEGSESAWYKWGNPLWSGGAAADYTQGAASPKGLPSGTGSQNGLTDNDFMDFDESPAESVVGWKGLTALGKLDVANTPMSLEATRVGYNNNWQAGYSASVPLLNVFVPVQDRSTNIIAIKLNHNFALIGGLDANFKYKRVDDRDKGVTTDPLDDAKVLDNGMTLSAGNQLFSQLYGTLSYGRYIRRYTVPGIEASDTKSIYGVRFAYNLPGFEVGMLTQWIQGYAGSAPLKVQQYRMKTYAQVNF